MYNFLFKLKKTTYIDLNFIIIYPRVFFKQNLIDVHCLLFSENKKLYKQNKSNLENFCWFHSTVDEILNKNKVFLLVVLIPSK